MYAVSRHIYPFHGLTGLMKWEAIWAVTGTVVKLALTKMSVTA